MEAVKKAIGQCLSFPVLPSLPLLLLGPPTNSYVWRTLDPAVNLPVPGSSCPRVVSPCVHALLHRSLK